MKNKWRILKILVTVVLLGFLMSFSLKRFAQKPLENIAVNLKQSPVYFVDEKDIKNLVKTYNPTHKVGDVDIPALEKKLNSLPAVDSANVYMNLNGNLNVDVKQRVPVFRLQKNGRDFYVDEKDVEFPISKNFSYPCMLVTGDVQRSEYPKLAELVSKIDHDDFSKNFFVGIAKNGADYNLLTSEGDYKVEIGSLDNIDFKVRGFKTFVEKYLVYQNPEKYKKISVKFDNQIVTTLNAGFKDNDSILNDGKKKIAVKPVIKPVAAGVSEVKPIAPKVIKKDKKIAKAKPSAKPKPATKEKPKQNKKKVVAKKPEKIKPKANPKEKKKAEAKKKKKVKVE